MELCATLSNMMMRIMRCQAHFVSIAIDTKNIGSQNNFLNNSNNSHLLLVCIFASKAYRFYWVFSIVAMLARAVFLKCWFRDDDMLT